MKEVCTECGEIINTKELNSKFKTIFDKIEAGCQEVTDVEESIYFNAYCTTCADRFLVDELRSQVYYDQ